jgi:hypothetical protein
MPFEKVRVRCWYVNKDCMLMPEILELELCDNDALRITGKLKFCGAPRSPLIDTCSIKLIMESAH